MPAQKCLRDKTTGGAARAGRLVGEHSRAAEDDWSLRDMTSTVGLDHHDFQVVDCSAGPCYAARSAGAARDDSWHGFPSGGSPDGVPRPVLASHEVHEILPVVP